MDFDWKSFAFFECRGHTFHLRLMCPDDHFSCNAWMCHLATISRECGSKEAVDGDLEHKSRERRELRVLIIQDFRSEQRGI